MAIQYINKFIPEGAQQLAALILKYLNEDKKVLWLVCGGSNMPISVEVLNLMKAELDKEGKRYILKNVTVTLTDERYSSINHPDSNWRQLREAGFDFDAVTSMPVLIGKSLVETTKMFGVNLRDAWSNNDVVIGQFGIGPDSHIAGVLPRTIGVSNPGTVVSYDAGKFKRVTITLATIAKLDHAYAFVYGESKREAINGLVGNLNGATIAEDGDKQNLHDSESSEATFEAQPAQILKKVKDAVVYSDLV